MPYPQVTNFPQPEQPYSYGFGVPASAQSPAAPAAPVYAGYAGGPFAAAPGATQNPVTQGLIPPPDPITDPTAAVIRALTSMGFNPGSFHPFVKAVMSRAKDLANELVLKSAAGGNAGLEDLADPSKAISALTSIVGRAGSGEKIFGGGTSGSLQNLVAAAQRGNQSESASPGDRFIAALLGDSGRAAGLYQESLYGGMTPKFQSAMSAGLINGVDAYARQQEANPKTAAENFLQFLIGQLAAGGAGAGAPGAYTSAYTPAGRYAAQQQAQQQ